MIIPPLNAYTALREIAHTWTGTAWFIEGDIADCLDAWSHCSCRSLWWSEQAVLGLGYVDA